MSDDLADLTATELLALFQSRQASPVEAVQACIARAEAWDGLNCVLTPTFDRALKDAEESTRRWTSDTARPLEGVPYGLKDIIATEGVLTTGGSALYRTWVPDRDATVAARLRSAGGIHLVKLQTFEFACGGAANKTFGPVRNPWDKDRTTGGSSSGSGAAVAAGIVPIAIGTDTGGSIRIPSAYCGITGLKPTYGRVPRTGVMGLSWTMDHIGPMVRCAADAARVLRVIAGPDHRDAYASAQAVPDYLADLERPIRGMRIGRPAGYLLERSHPQVLEAYDAALAVLVDAGAAIIDVNLPLMHLSEPAGWMIIYAEMLSLHEGHLDGVDDRDEMGAGLLSRGPFVTASDYLRAMRVRPVFQESIGESFDEIDLLATPGATTVAPRLDDMLADLGDAKMDWLQVATRTSLPFNLSGQPGMCVPSGFVAGLPVSLQLVGMPHGEISLFRVAAAFQRQTSYHRAQPLQPTIDAPLNTRSLAHVR
jgi:aspartyl-tRNA(Asn)/glutamyl-tRNA(Gln) amidotransferase subunit A